jgi:hypothetical protein
VVRVLLAAALVTAASPPAPEDAAEERHESAAVRPTHVLKLGLPDPRLRMPRLGLTFNAPRPSESLQLGGVPLRPVELSRAETSLKGLHLGATSAMFLGALNASYGMWGEEKSWWLIGGAAALGALYGGTLGYENDSFRVEARWEED